MKNSKYTFLIGFVILIVLIVAVSFQLSKKLQVDDALTEEFFNRDTILRIERIEHSSMTEIETSKENQKEIQEVLRKMNLKGTDNSYSPLDADYRIVSTSNQDDQLYLFVEENVIVFPLKSSKGYKMKNNVELTNFMESFF